MGGKNSAQNFEFTIQCFTKSLLFHYPQIFTTKQGKYRELWSWLDDFVGKKSDSSLSKAFRLAMDAQALILSHAQSLGLRIAPKKTLPPDQIAVLLGLELNAKDKTISLKPGKFGSYAKDLRHILRQKKIPRKKLEELHGKLTYASLIVPQIKPLLPTYSDPLYNENAILRTRLLKVNSIVFEYLKSNPKLD